MKLPDGLNAPNPLALILTHSVERRIILGLDRHRPQLACRFCEMTNEIGPGSASELVRIVKKAENAQPSAKINYAEETSVRRSNLNIFSIKMQGCGADGDADFPLLAKAFSCTHDPTALTRGASKIIHKLYVIH